MQNESHIRYPADLLRTSTHMAGEWRLIRQFIKTCAVKSALSWPALSEIWTGWPSMSVKYTG